MPKRTAFEVDGVLHKQCADCGETKPVESGFGWRVQSGRKYPQSFCCACHNRRRRSGHDGRYARKSPRREAPPSGHRWCARCAQAKLVKEFPGQRGGYCLPCRRAYAQENAQVAQGVRLARLFGLSAQAYRTLLDAQEGKCAVCREPERERDSQGRVKTLAVDHDHACCPGKGSCGRCVRALLCGSCNKAIGGFQDDSARMRAAADYVDRYRAT